MSESQSRYSIIERLTRTKLDLMTSRNDIKSDLMRKKQKVITLTKKLENWEVDFDNNKIKEKTEKQNEIKNVEVEAINFEVLMKDKETLYNEKIIAIEQALNQLEVISNASQSSSE